MDYISVENTKSNNQQQSSRAGLFLVGLTGGLAAVISIICFPFISPAFRRICLPYVPATNQQVENILKALKNRSGSLIDLGSGDGRIVLATAKAGFRAHGIELNPWLILYSRLNALTCGLSLKTKFFKQDLWKYNLKHYNNIVLFGVEQMMQDIEKKFMEELQKDCFIVVCRFPLPNMHPIKTIGVGVDTVWIYQIKRSY